MFSLRLKELRKEHNITQKDFAEIFNISNGTIAMWETEKRTPDTETIKKIATYFHVSTDYLLGHVNDPWFHLDNERILRDINSYEDDDNTSRGIRIPVLGSIPAGIPIEAIEDVLDYEEIPADWTTGGREYFALKIQGDSMEPKYLDDDIVIFQKAETCDSGTECAVMVNGYDATFKKVIIQKSGIVLQPLNTRDHEPTFYSNSEVNELPVRVIGIAKELRRPI